MAIFRRYKNYNVIHSILAMVAHYTLFLLLGFVMKVHQKPIYAVGIGPGKAGTTWLYNQLSRHSEISTCKIKEPYFFTENFKYGFKWYKSLFSQNRPVRLEISNRYIFEFEELNGNLKKFDENILIIYFDRDPFDRTSAFLFEKQMGQVLTVEEF